MYLLIYSLLSCVYSSCVLDQYIQVTSLRSLNSQRETTVRHVPAQRTSLTPAGISLGHTSSITLGAMSQVPSIIIEAGEIFSPTFVEVHVNQRLPRHRCDPRNSTNAVLREIIWRYLRRRNPRHPNPTSRVSPALSTRSRITRVNSYLGTVRRH